jgi:GT2 family glycosyltransferase
MSDSYPLNKVLIFSATQKAKPDETVLYESITEWNDGLVDLDVIFCVENDKSLSIVYNEAIDEAIRGDYDGLILVHDDVILEYDPIPKLGRLFTQYGLVGVAGSSKIRLTSPALWHLMGGGFSGGNLHGSIAHGDMNTKHMTSFGPYPHRTLLIDGVFMALTKETFNKVRFDETNPAGFHFYDLDYSYTCATSGIKVGVGDINITHASPGLSDVTPEWKSGEEWFLTKHTT